MENDKYSFFDRNKVSVLFHAKSYGEKFGVAIKESRNYKGEKIFVFGRLYDLGYKFDFSQQGMQSFDEFNICALRACEFFGVVNKEYLKLFAQ